MSIGFVNGAILIPEITAVATFLNHGWVYTKNDNKLYFTDGADVEHDISGSPTFTGLTLTGDISTTGTAIDWDLQDNVASALSFDCAGKTGLLNFVTTNTAEGIVTSGYFGIGSSTEAIRMEYDSTQKELSLRLFKSGTTVMQFGGWPSDVIYEDFMSPFYSVAVEPNTIFSDVAWYFVTSGGSGPLTETRHGTVLLQTGTSNGNVTYIRSHTKVFGLSAKTRLGCWVDIDDPASNQYDFFFGLDDTPNNPAASSNYARFTFSVSGGAANWIIESDDAGVGPFATDTGVAVTAGKHFLYMIASSAAVFFYIDGVSVGSRTTFIPSNNSYLFMHIETTESAANEVELDKIFAFVEHDTGYW